MTKEESNKIAYERAIEADRVLSIEVAETITDKNFVEVEYVKTTHNKECKKC